MTKRKLRYSSLGLALLTVGAIAACSSTDNSGGPGGTAGTGTGGARPNGGAGGTPGVAGANTAGASTAGAAGAATAGTGAGGGASAGFACTNTMPTAALITDFSNLVPSTDPNNAGNFTFVGGVLGGTYSYQPAALTLDTVTNTVLNVKGHVTNYDGFGLYFNTCYDAKTLGYTGISFSIKGYAGPKGTVNFRVSTNANTAYNVPVNMAAMKGQCKATDPNEPYPDCHAAGVDVPVTATATVVTVNFSQLTGGLPTNEVTGADIVGIEWALDWTPGATGTAGAGAGGASGGSAGASAGAGGASAGAGGASAGAGGKGGSGGSSAGAGGSSAGSGGSSVGSGGAAAVGGPYDANITIDDVKFIGGPPAGGAGGGGAGGASGGSGGASAGSGGASAGSGGSSGGSAGKAGSGG